MKNFTPCYHLQRIVEDPSVPLNYRAIWDEYFILRSGGESEESIQYCPFCGHKLPESKRSCFFDELEKLGIDYELGAEFLTLPAKFRSDDWWKR